MQIGTKKWQNWLNHILILHFEAWIIFSYVVFFNDSQFYFEQHDVTQSISRQSHNENSHTAVNTKINQGSGFTYAITITITGAKHTVDFRGFLFYIFLQWVLF